MQFFNNFSDMYNSLSDNNKSVFNALSFVKLNNSPIEIEFSYTDDGEDAKAGFYFDGVWYELDNFVRCDNPHWGLNDSSIPSYITAYDTTDCWNTYYISVSDDGATVDVYERRDV